jgi:lipopolysaccharide transport system permease protein
MSADAPSRTMPGSVFKAVLRDLSILTAAYALAYLARFPGSELETMMPGALRWAPAVIAAQIAGLALGRRYGGGGWGIPLAGLLAGTAAGHLVSYAWIQNLEIVSRAAFVLDVVLALPAVWLGSARRLDATDDPELIDAAGAGVGLLGSLVALVQFRELIRNLVFKDLKLKYRGSFFGFLWSMLNPLVMITVYLIAFKYIMQVRSGNFVFLLLLGILAWTFFAASASMGAGAIVDNGGLLKTVQFPRAVLPIASVLFNLAQYLLTIAVFLPLMLVIYQLPPRPSMLLFPVVVFLQVAMTIGIALALSAGTAFFRDIRHFLEIALMVMFWTTPIIYDYQTQVPKAWRWPVLLSPMSPFVLAYQDIFYYGRLPPPEVCTVAVLYATVAFFGGFALFTRVQHEFVEQI